MLNERIKLLRKKKGLSQEELALHLNVVRQTISKWEKGYSVPDADMLAKLANELEVSADELLSVKIEIPEEKDRLANELAHINAQLAQKNGLSKRILKLIVIVFIIALSLSIIWIFWGVHGMRNVTNLPAHACIDGNDEEVDPRNIPIEISPP